MVPKNEDGLFTRIVVGNAEPMGEVEKGWLRHDTTSHHTQHTLARV